MSITTKLYRLRSAAALLVTVAGLGFSLTAAAATPTLALSGVGNDSVQLTVTGDPNSTVVLFYNVGATTGVQTSILGTTDGAGQFSKTISVSSLALNTANSVYVMVNSQQSETKPWATTGSTSTTSSSGITFSSTSASVGVGATTNITLSGGTSYYVNGNTTPGLTTQSFSGNVMTITGIAAGSTTLTVCTVAGSCGTISVTVGGAATTTTSGSTTTTGQAVNFSVSNPTLTVGQVLNVALSGSSSYFISIVSNPIPVQSFISASTLTLSGVTPGSTSITVCATAGGCGVISVTVSNTATSATATTPAAPVVAATPAATAPATPANNASVLSTIQTMQSQLSQILLVIQTMQSQLTLLTAGMTGSTASASAASPAFSGSFKSLLALGSSGAEVTALQQKLIKEGYLSGSATGYFGSLTASALKKYQTAKGIDPTGYTGPGTRAALNGE
jgi:hypothetical protein